MTFNKISHNIDVKNHLLRIHSNLEGFEIQEVVPQIIQLLAYLQHSIWQLHHMLVRSENHFTESSC